MLCVVGHRGGVATLGLAGGFRAHATREPRPWRGLRERWWSRLPDVSGAILRIVPKIRDVFLKLRKEVINIENMVIIVYREEWLRSRLVFA